MRELSELDRIHLVLALQRHTAKAKLQQQARAWGRAGRWPVLHAGASWPAEPARELPAPACLGPSLMPLTAYS